MGILLLVCRRKGRKGTGGCSYRRREITKLVVEEVGGVAVRRWAAAWSGGFEFLVVVVVVVGVGVVIVRVGCGGGGVGGV